MLLVWIVIIIAGFACRELETTRACRCGDKRDNARDKTRYTGNSMCNRYNIKGTTKEISEHFNATLPLLFEMPSDDILPGHLARFDPQPRW
jgi:hypothetical protein